MNGSSSSPEAFLGKGVLKICRKFTGENPVRSVISAKMQINLIDITLQHACSTVNLLHIFRTLSSEQLCRAASKMGYSRFST